MTGEDVDVTPLLAVTGQARVADGRPLAQATVIALPSQCPPTATSSGATSATDPSCMPRSAATTTDAAGAYALALDPGQYVLSIRPVQGSNLPWVNHPLVVGQVAQVVPPVTIPAPVSVGTTLMDQSMNPVSSAIVRVFTTPTATTPPIELGQAVTGVDGSYDLYVALPPTQ